jgi:hypothetical protein
MFLGSIRGPWVACVLSIWSILEFVCEVLGHAALASPVLMVAATADCFELCKCGVDLTLNSMQMTFVECQGWSAELAWYFMQRVE